MKIRSASFATMQAMGPCLVGTRYEQLADAVMSFPDGHGRRRPLTLQI